MTIVMTKAVYWKLEYNYNSETAFCFGRSIIDRKP